MKINKIYQIDCIEGMKKIKDETIDEIVTDPPYLISYKTNRRKNKKHKFCSEIKNDNNYKLISEYIKQCYRILKDNTAMYIFCNADNVDFFKKELEKNSFKIKNMIIWVKNNWTAGDLNGQFAKQYEIIFLVNKGRRELNSKNKRESDVWFFDKITGKNQIHQNQKPEALIRRCIEEHSNKSDIIFDGFMGSGTTAVVSKALGRRYIGFEIDEYYYNKTIERLKQTTIIKGTDIEDWLK